MQSESDAIKKEVNTATKKPFLPPPLSTRIYAPRPSYLWLVDLDVSVKLIEVFNLGS